MASTDLTRLYSAKNTIEKYYAAMQPLENAKKREISTLKRDHDALMSDLDRHYNAVSVWDFFLKRASIAIILAVVFFTVVLVGSGSFLSSVLSPDLYSTIEEFHEYIEKDPDSAPKGYDKANDEERNRIAVQEFLPMLASNILLVTIIFAYGIPFLYKLIVGKKSKYLDYIYIPSGLFLVASIIFIIAMPTWCELNTGLSSGIGTEIILQSFLLLLPGIFFIFQYTWKFTLFVVAFQLSLYIPGFMFLIMKEKFVPTSKKCTSISEKMNSCVLQYKKEYSEICNKWNAKIKATPYFSTYNLLPSYLKDYKLVMSLIWAIENGYAYDIVSARNYWDRKAHDASVKRQLEKVQSTADAALKAASTPPDVKVDITIYE